MCLKKKLDLSRGEKCQEKREERRRWRGAGWRTGEEDCLFSAGQTRLSSTFSHRDESALRGCQRPLALAAPGKQGEEYRRQRGETQSVDLRGKLASGTQRLDHGGKHLKRSHIILMFFIYHPGLCRST